MKSLPELLAAQLPVWLAALPTILSVIGMAWCPPLLLRRIKRLEQELHEHSLTFEKQLAFVQERHAKRIDALDELNATLMQFAHAVGHVSQGHGFYVDHVEPISEIARIFARKHESLLGRDVYDSVLRYTDTGRAILDAHFCVTERAVQVLQAHSVLQAHGVSPKQLRRLQRLVGTQYPVRDIGALVLNGTEYPALKAIQNVILGASEISGQFDREAYELAARHFEEVKQQILRTL